MRALVVLAVLGVCSAFPFIPDAPDVADEKARFFHAFRAAHDAAMPKPGYVPKKPYKPQPRWTGPVAATIPAAVDGTITPVSHTREVAVARNEFFNTYRAQVAATLPKPGAPVQYHAAPSYRPAPPPQPKWTGPVAATIPASLPGSTPQVADTPEVNAAKQVFFDTYLRQAEAVKPPVQGYF